MMIVLVILLNQLVDAIREGEREDGAELYI